MNAMHIINIKHFMRGQRLPGSSHQMYSDYDWYYRIVNIVSITNIINIITTDTL